MLRWFRSSSTIATLPRPSGPYSVGFVDYEWSPSQTQHSDRPPSFVLARIYYPSKPVAEREDPSGSEPEWAGRSFWIPSPDYYPGYGYYMKMPWYLASPLFRLMAGNVSIWAVENAPPVLESQLDKVPLIIFSHGLGGIRTTYSTICTSLASNGYIVAAIEHRRWIMQLLSRRDGSASMSMQQDETVLQYRHPPKNDDAAHEFRTLQLQHRRQEVSATIDLLLTDDSQNMTANIWKAKSARRSTSRDDFVEDPLSLLKGRIQKVPIGICGHSFGAATSFLASQQDDRIGSVLALDPWMFPIPSDFITTMTRGLPVLVINSETFHWPTNLESIATLLARNKELHGFPSMQVTVIGTGHMDQSDFSAAMPAWLFGRFRGGGTAEPQQALATNTRLVTAFIDGVFQRNSECVDPYRTLIWGNVDRSDGEVDGESDGKIEDDGKDNVLGGKVRVEIRSPTKPEGSTFD